MTKKLETLFDLPPSPSKEVSDALEVAHGIDISLPEVVEDRTDHELDELADKAVESFENLQSLGMNVEARFSAPIFDAASKMLGHAVTAKLGKVQKKLKETELKMRMMKMQQQANPEPDSVTVEAKVFDRNELLKTFGKKQ